MPVPFKSDKQRKFFGLIASGKKPRTKTSLTPEEAKKALHENAAYGAKEQAKALLKKRRK
jgi:hypothetical protein